MGLIQSISNFFDKKFGKKPVRFYMVGLDAVGKTSILYKLKMGDLIQTHPTIGFNIEMVKYKNLTITFWDVGGDLDPKRIELAAQELHRFSSEVAEYDVPVLIFANKQDCEGAMNLEEITKALHPDDLKHKTWHIQLCSAKTGEGLYEGLEWLGKIVRSEK